MGNLATMKPGGKLINTHHNPNTGNNKKKLQAPTTINIRPNKTNETTKRNYKSPVTLLSAL